MHTLIIEDEAFVALDLQIFLEELGADSCALAATEAEAVREAFEQRPDLIASDVDICGGSGPNAVKAIRAHMGEIPAIYITGNPRAAQAEDPGAPVVPKPIRWLELVQATSQFGLPPSEGDKSDAEPAQSPAR